MNSNYAFGTEARTAQASLFKNVYVWMALALAVTGLTAWTVATSAPLQQALFGGSFTLLVLLLAELGLVWYLSAQIATLSFPTASLLFLVYSLLNGLTLSVIFLVYTTASVASTFFVTAGTFGAMSLYGYVTKRDLSSWGNLLFMALIGVILATIVNIFLKSPALYWAVTYLGIFVFVGLTAYDTQKIKRMLADREEDETGQKIALMGALALYLDFVNLFLYLLRLLGKRR